MSWICHRQSYVSLREQREVQISFGGFLAKEADDDQLLRRVSTRFMGERLSQFGESSGNVQSSSIAFLGCEFSFG